MEKPIVYLSYNQEDKNVVDFVNGLKSAMGDDCVSFKEYEKGDDYSNFWSDLQSSSMIICFLCDKFFREEFCMAQLIAINENLTKKILYVKNDVENICLKNGTELIHGFDFESNNAEYYDELCNHWIDYQNKQTDNSKKIDLTPIAKFLSEHNYCLDLLKKINTIISGGNMMSLSDGIETIKNHINNKFSFIQEPNNLKYDFVISTSSNDKENKYFKKILELLKPYQYWYYEHQRHTYLGDDYGKAIFEAIDNCKCLLYILSKNSIKSEDCIKEVGYASEKKIKIVPMYLEEGLKLNHDINYSFGTRKHGVRCYNDKWETDFKKFLADIHNDIHEGESGLRVLLHKIKEIFSKYSILIYVLAILIATLALGYFCVYVYDGSQYQNDVLVQADYNKRIIKVNDGTKKIKAGALYQCINLLSIELPNTIESIEARAFDSCINLSEIVLPKSLKSIGPRAFKDCFSLKKVIIPSAIKHIDINPFFGSDKCKVEFDSGKEFSDDSTYAIINGYIIDMADSSIISYCGDNTTTKNIPNIAKKIGKYAFCNNKSLNEIDFSNSNITEIDDLAFANCTNVKKIVLTKSLSKMGLNPFLHIQVDEYSIIATGEKVSNIHLDNGLLILNRHLIAYIGKNKSVDLDVKTLSSFSESITHINQWAFDDCGMYNVDKGGLCLEEVHPDCGLTAELIYKLLNH